MREDEMKALAKGMAVALKPVFADIERRMAALERQVEIMEKTKATREGAPVYANH